MEIKITKVNNGYLIEDMAAHRNDWAHFKYIASNIEEMEKVIGKIAVFGFLKDGPDFVTGKTEIITIYGTN